MPVTPITIDVVQKHLESDRRWRERRHDQWRTNYTLSRDTVIVNRLTQRQSVNVPYMKKTLKTYLTQTNWPVDNYYEEKGNDKQKELFLNAYWDACMDRLKLDILEEVDRKQEWLYGRSFMKLNILDGWIHMEVIDPQDILLDRYMNPWDMNSARRVTHVGIYRTLSDVERNPMYNAAAIKELKTFFSTQQGLIVAGQNSLMAADKAQRMIDMGATDVQNPILGETYVELNEMQYKSWDPVAKEDVIMVCVTANQNQILMDKPMRDILGVNIFTIATWAGDVERTDVWSDGGADSVQQLNLVANARWSQKVENGDLANYGMQFYDSTKKEGWTPIGYDPAPFGFYPLPGPPRDVLQAVSLPTMPDVYEEMNWIDMEIQGVSGATATEAGQEDPNGKAQTLGEIQLLADKAKARAKNVSKYHKRYWEDIGNIYVALVMANGKDMAKPRLHKKSVSDVYWPHTLDLSKTYSKEGYKVKVGSKADKESDALQMIQKLNVARAQFPMNVPLRNITKDKILDWLNLTPEETKEVMEFDDQMPALPGTPPGAPPVPLELPGRMPSPVAA